MKLLFDENLGARLAHDLTDLYPDSTHVLSIGLAGAGDRAIWARAATDGFILVTKDQDFHRLSVALGSPPKVLWIRLGNCTTVGRGTPSPLPGGGCANLHPGCRG